MNTARRCRLSTAAPRAARGLWAWIGPCLVSAPLWLGAGCSGGTATMAPIKGPLVTPVADARWRTMHAEHVVHIDAAKGDGREQTDVRGIIAVERPDRFRLRALGPGGLTLFDLLKVGGDVRIIQGVTGADSSLQQKVLLSIGADLAAAYDLEPRLPSRTKEVALKEGEVRVVEQPERAVRLSQYKAVQGQSVPTHMEIRNSALDYNVSVDVVSATLDEKLDPALFTR